MRNGSAPLGSIQPATLASLAACWPDRDKDLIWDCPFVLPPWLAAWWPHFAADYAPYGFTARRQGQLAGIAPLMRKGAQAHLIGDADICDHLDLVMKPRHAESFCLGLLEHLARDGIRQLVLAPVREDSAVITHLLPMAKALGARVHCDQREKLFAMPLPTSWEAYLQGLSGKERHEIRRKLRRLNKAGHAVMRCIDDADMVPAAMEIFIDLFKANRTDKAGFMTGPMPSFFQSLALNLAVAGILKLYFLDLDNRPIAATFCIDYRSTVYLYNNGYDADFRSLSVGLLSKILTIKAGIRDGRKVYDFLKGSEVYKKRLGGQPVKIYHCQVDLDPLNKR